MVGLIAVKRGRIESRPEAYGEVRTKPLKIVRVLDAK
jgi:hypothetical protein